jgi:hypothetical protein
MGPPVVTVSNCGYLKALTHKNHFFTMYFECSEKHHVPESALSVGDNIITPSQVGTDLRKLRTNTFVFGINSPPVASVYKIGKLIGKGEST